MADDTGLDFSDQINALEGKYQQVLGWVSNILLKTSTLEEIKNKWWSFASSLIPDIYFHYLHKIFGLKQKI